MAAAKTAKHYGVQSLTALSESSGYNLDTLRRMHNDRPGRFKLMCLGHVCDALGLGGQELIDFAKLKRSIEGNPHGCKARGDKNV